MRNLLASELDSIIGRRLRIEEYGCDDSFADLLPCDGVIERRIEASNGVKDWYLMKLDEPFNYDGRLHTHILVRSRRDNATLGEPGEISAFVLLITDLAALDERPIQVSRFLNVGYVIARIATAPVREDDTKSKHNEPRIRCRHCRASYRISQLHCPECGAAHWNPFSDEMSLVLKIFAGLLFIGAILWAVIRVDPSIPASIRQSSMWIKAPLALSGVVVLWAVLDLIIRRVFRRR